ncbi:uncharacterized protein [Tursiops truncatus]|uniref:uncharacterized protein isoform X2 n=1 Tax=Tursiops truncatus TaxID=9739 RepID=UPI003CCFC8CA
MPHSRVSWETSVTDAKRLCQAFRLLESVSWVMGPSTFKVCSSARVHFSSGSSDAVWISTRSSRCPEKMQLSLQVSTRPQILSLLPSAEGHCPLWSQIVDLVPPMPPLSPPLTQDTWTAQDAPEDSGQGQAQVRGSSSFLLAPRKVPKPPFH